jgi:hypothetical protein
MPRDEALAEIDAWEHDLGDLVSVAEIAQRAGVAVATVQSWRRRRTDFPEPVVRLAAGPVWRWDTVAEWIAVPRPGGRPRKG